MRGIAHISFAGGGLVLPAANPYDREILFDHIAHRTRSKGAVRVTVDDSSWSVRYNDGSLAPFCAACGRALEAACYSNFSGGAAYCIRCAFGGHLVVPNREVQSLRGVG